MSRIEQLERIAEMSPDDPLAHYAVGLELNTLERWTDAVAAFDRALATDADYSAAYFHKAKALIKAGRGDDARQTLTTGIDVANRSGDMKTVREMTDLRDLIH